jgi:hypothetical protein
MYMRVVVVRVCLCVCGAALPAARGDKGTRRHSEGEGPIHGVVVWVACEGKEKRKEGKVRSGDPLSPEA